MTSLPSEVLMSAPCGVVMIRSFLKSPAAAIFANSFSRTGFRFLYMIVQNFGLVLGFITGFAGCLEASADGSAGFSFKRYFLRIALMRLSFCIVKLLGCICSNAVFQAVNKSGSAFEKRTGSIFFAAR